MQKRSQKSKKHLRSRSERLTAKEKPRVSIIGAGRLGTALGLALSAAGYRIEVVVAKHQLKARRAARAIDADTLGLIASQLNRLDSNQHNRFNRSALILIATPDDVIAPVAEQLASTFKSKPEQSRRDEKAMVDRRVVLHTSGALSSEALSPLRDVGFATGSLHPLVSISDSFSGAKLLTRAFFSVEGDPAAVRFGKSIVRDLGGQYFIIDALRKPLYHAAALTASGNMVALFDIALEMLGHCGLSPRRAREVLLPLVESTLANLSTRDPARALTGTFKRGDVSTVRKHLAAIESEQLSDALAAYVLLGRRSLGLSRKRNANNAGQNRIARILSANARVSRER